MKKLTSIVALVALLFAASSCSKENVAPTKASKIAVAGDKSDVSQNQMPPP